ncbi:MAG: hypothetical protein U9P00_03015 [Pseudomonadota bacterium]|nr:hypothetical protein [Pseudomonadota bacterium]
MTIDQEERGRLMGDHTKSTASLWVGGKRCTEVSLIAHVNVTQAAQT